MGKKRSRSTQTIPKEETKADRFVRVVTLRVKKAMKAIRTVGFCAGATYEYTPKQSEQIVTALLRSVQTLAKRFEEKKSDEPEFDFAD